MFAVEVEVETRDERRETTGRGWQKQKQLGAWLGCRGGRRDGTVLSVPCPIPVVEDSEVRLDKTGGRLLPCQEPTNKPTQHPAPRSWLNACRF